MSSTITWLSAVVPSCSDRESCARQVSLTPRFSSKTVCRAAGLRDQAKVTVVSRVLASRHSPATCLHSSGWKQTILSGLTRNRLLRCTEQTTRRSSVFIVCQSSDLAEPQLILFASWYVAIEFYTNTNCIYYILHEQVAEKPHFIYLEIFYNNWLFVGLYFIVSKCNSKLVKIVNFIWPSFV